MAAGGNAGGRRAVYSERPALAMQSRAAQRRQLITKIDNDIEDLQRQGRTSRERFQQPRETKSQWWRRYQRTTRTDQQVEARVAELERRRAALIRLPNTPERRDREWMANINAAVARNGRRGKARVG